MIPGRRSQLAAALLVSLVAAAFVAPACRVGYQELDGVAVGLAGGASGNEAGEPGSIAGSTVVGGAADAGATSSGGSAAPGGNGGTTSGGNGGSAVTVAGAGGDASTAPPCTSTAHCACEELSGHSYWFCTQELSWDAANALCQTADMSLVRIDRATENDFVLMQASAHNLFVTPMFYAHIGANDQAAVGEWRWVDGTLFWQGGMLVKGMYANWDSKSPSDMSVQRCSGMLASGLWQDRSCTAVAPFICESP